MSRHITIHSDGTGHGTVLLDTDGNKLDNISSVNFNIEANGISEATIEIHKVNIVAESDVKTVNVICPLCIGFIEHTCDPAFNSAPENQRGSNLFDFVICGLLKPHNGKTAICYINKELPHHQHCDVKQGISWDAI